MKLLFTGYGKHKPTHNQKRTTIQRANLLFNGLFYLLKKNDLRADNTTLYCFMHRTVLIIIGIVSFLHAFSQQPEITVKVINSQRQPLISANVELLKMDSSLVKIAVSDSNGVV